MREILKLNENLNFSIREELEKEYLEAPKLIKKIFILKMQLYILNENTIHRVRIKFSLKLL